MRWWQFSAGARNADGSWNYTIIVKLIILLMVISGVVSQAPNKHYWTSCISNDLKHGGGTQIYFFLFVTSKITTGWTDFVDSFFILSWYFPSSAILIILKMRSMRKSYKSSMCATIGRLIKKINITPTDFYDSFFVGKNVFQR